MTPPRKPTWRAETMARAATMLSILLSLLGSLLGLQVLLQVAGLAEGGR
jgi:hypothetical protein